MFGKIPGEGNDNPLRYSWLENSTDRGAWQATVHGVAKSQTRLSNYKQLNQTKQSSLHTEGESFSDEENESVKRIKGKFAELSDCS